MNHPAGYGHPTEYLKTAAETRLQNALLEPFWSFLAQKLGAKNSRKLSSICHFFANWQICESLLRADYWQIIFELEKSKKMP